MSTTSHHDERMAKMSFGLVYPLYIQKVEKKGRTQKELNQIITWLTGYDDEEIKKHAHSEISFKEFFADAKLNPNAQLITGVICGYRVEEITNPLTQKVRYLDKLVDELAKGKAMDKILRE